MPCTRLRFVLHRTAPAPADAADGPRLRLEWRGVRGAGGSEHLRMLRIRGATARAVRRVEVRDRDRIVFALESVTDDTGRLTSAGELLAAMAAMTGRRGLEIDLHGTAPAIGTTTVRVDIGTGPACAGVAIALEAVLD